MVVKVTGRKEFDYVERFEGFQPIRATERQVVDMKVTLEVEAAHSSKCLEQTRTTQCKNPKGNAFCYRCCADCVHGTAIRAHLGL
jgi:hypothetical protein